MNNYAQRRARLLAQIEKDSTVILVGNTEKVRSKNILFPFRQDNDFYYLTGYAEPDAVAILRPDSDQPFVLFNQAKDEATEINFGTRAGQEAAISDYGADAAYPIEQLELKLPELLGQRSIVYWSDEQQRYQHRLFDWLHQQRFNARFDEIKIFRQLRSVLPLIHNERRVKDQQELELLRHAINASVDGHRYIMQNAANGVTEQQLTAEFFNQIAKHGCQAVGYPTIMATGNNACCLHYSENQSTLQDGQMLLIDAGGEFNYYTADITRTFPVNGIFSGPQRDIYQLVLDSLDAAIATVKPGASWNSMYPAAMEVLARGLIDLGILTASFDEVWNKQLYKPFSIHKTGHWLGLDVHDVGAYHDDQQQWQKLQPNMVFTIEPGLYFPQHCETVDEKWRGMGVRIEDDILVTATGNENLSAGAPRTIAEIEQIMSR